MPTFSWGVSYNRIASFDRDYNVYNASTQTSLSNYIAAFTNALEPILIVLIASVVGFVAIAILMAVFKVSSSLG